MTAAAPGVTAPLHRRSLVFSSSEDPSLLHVRGELRDERPWAEGTHQAVLHHMQLDVSVTKEDLEIVAAKARMHHFPHAECPEIERSVKKLIGLKIERGFRRKVNERIAGVAGCVHLLELARALAPTVIQVRASARARTRALGDQARPSGDALAWASGMCHVLEPDGPFDQKLATGWRPGDTEFPVPPADELSRHPGSTSRQP